MLAATVACDQPAPAAPGHAPSSQPPPAANQAPTIITFVNPALGIDDLTTMTVMVDVRDPDGDAVSLRASGCTLGTDVPVPLTNGVATIAFVPNASCSWSITLNAADSRGAGQQATVPIQHTRFSRWYRLVIGEGFYDTPFYYVNLEQSGTSITGTIRDIRGHAGTVDPPQPGNRRGRPLPPALQDPVGGRP